MKIGFIGYGSMGSMIIEGLLDSSVLKRDDVIISNRTLNKLDKIKKEYPEIEITNDNEYLASECQKIFIFVGTFAVKEILEDIKKHINPNTHIIHISAALTLENIEKVFEGKITKIIPSLTSTVKEGVSLIHHNKNVDEKEAEFINKVFESIGDVKIVQEEDFEVGSDLTSCAPAFIASIFQKFAETGSTQGNFTYEESEKMVIKTLYGTVKLLYEENMSFDDIISRVATKGGITEQGVKILEKELPETFDDLFKTTLKRHEEIKEELRQQYKTND
ncbi:MAG TPA: pyrroline-5-carboxylate reductase dimerization domain-containing protein [Methanobacterium sp.]|nr:pyrroline-5-carboxylate reductase dimerization domain-containing protein [Methanobacterium sp.]